MYKHTVNYFYVFSDELLVDRIDVPTGDKYMIMGVKERDSPFVMGSLVNDFKFDWCHVFKCFETITIETEKKNGNLNLDCIPFVDILKMSEHITSFGGMNSNVGI